MAMFFQKEVLKQSAIWVVTAVCTQYTAKLHCYVAIVAHCTWGACHNGSVAGNHV